jgi:hypothetical protein
MLNPASEKMEIIHLVEQSRLLVAQIRLTEYHFHGAALQMRLNRVALIPAVALLLTALPILYAVHLPLQVIVTGFSIFFLFRELNKTKFYNHWSFFFLLIGLVFNPFFPFRFDRMTWEIIKIAASCVFFGYAFFCFGFKRKHWRLHH